MDIHTYFKYTPSLGLATPSKQHESQERKKREIES